MTRRNQRAVFRRPLREIYQENGGALPVVVKESLEVLRENGLDNKGLFSGYGEEKKLRLLEKAWDQGQNPLRLLKIKDCYAVAGSLLLWLKALPTPLIPCKLFTAFTRIQWNQQPAEAFTQLHYLFCQMEEYELQLLTILLEFLHDYKFEQLNAGNHNPGLGSIFGPVLLRAHEGPLPLPFPEELRAAAVVVEHMISDFPAIFAHPSTCCSAVKPPSRAKKGPSYLKAELSSVKLNRECGQKGAARFAAKAPSSVKEAWPGKHLRVVVVPPYKDAEVCYMESDEEENTNQSFSPEQICHPFRNIIDNDTLHVGRLATVPESSPLDFKVLQQDADLEDVVGALLCGSIEKSMIFEEDDELFLASTNSMLSCRSGSMSCTQSNSGDSTDMSVDDMADASESSFPSPTILPFRV